MKIRSNKLSRTATWTSRLAKALGFAGLMAAGTIAQSTMVEVESGATGSSPRNQVVMNGYVYFTANTTASGNELWRWDGTSATLAADIFSGAGSSDPSDLVVFNNALYFSATNGSSGRELWKFDGTSASLVSDINAGAGDSDPDGFTVYNNNLYFAASNGLYSAGKQGRELWRMTSGGVAALFKDCYTGGSALAGITNEGNPRNFVVANGKLFFQATNANGSELWVSTGTAASTTMLVDVYPGNSALIPFPANSSSPSNLTVFGTNVVFSATTADGTELWVTDGTSGGTLQVANINAGSASSSPANLTVLGSNLLFSANNGTNGVELWSYDGATASLVSDIRSGANSSSPANFHVWAGNSVAFFSANDGSSGVELWKTDGTAGGTVLVKDINSGSGNSSPVGITSVSSSCVDGVLFAATTSAGGTELWRSNGTAAQTARVQDIFPGSSSSITMSPPVFSKLGSKVLFAAESTSGNEEPFYVNTWVLDYTAPTVTCPSGTSASADATCHELIPDYCIGATAADDCNVFTRSQNPAVGAQANLGANPVTVTITDENGNIATCSATFTVNDATAPTITIGVAQPTSAYSANGSCQFATPNFSATALDNCTSSLTVTQTPASGVLKGLGTHQVSFSVADAAGNLTTLTNSRSFTVSDQTAPVVTIANADPANPLAANASCQAATPDFGATASDNCVPGLTVTQDPAAGSAKNLGSYQVSFTVTDGNGNTTTLTNSRSFSVSDQSAPTISIAVASPSSAYAADGNCQYATPNFGATATDNCTSPLTVTQNPASGVLKGLGTHQVSFTVTDTAGNTATLSNSRSFSVADQEFPTISIAVASPASAFAADGNCQYATPDFGATATDNCTSPLTVTQDPASNVLKGLGTHQVSFTVTDAAGNTTTLASSRSFSVSDQTAPTITISVASPASPLAANGTCQAATPDFGATSSDNCSGVLAVTQSPASGDPVGLGTHQVSFTVTDTAGNTATLSNSRSFSVSDQSAPTITIANANPAGPLAANASCQAVTPDFGATSSDNCYGVLAVTQTPASGVVKGLGSYQVSFTVTDTAGNTATLSNSRSFSVSDQSAPTISIAVASPTSAFAADGNCQYATPDFGATSLDNCDGALAVTQIPASGVLKGLGTHQVSFTVTDAAGNTATSSNSRSFSVSDQSAPTITIAQPDPVNPLAANATCQAATPDFGATALDNCSPSLTVTQSPAAGELKNLGSYQVSFTVTDAAGNTATSSNARSFSVSDQSAPTISIAQPDPSGPLAANGTCQAATPNFGATATDNCTASLTVTQNPAAGSMKNLGTYQVSFTVTDTAGNVETLTNSRSFSVSDQSAPTISIAVADPTSAFAAGTNCQYATPDFGATSTDNCDGVLAVTQIPASGVLKGLGTHQVSFTVTDAAGNTATSSNSRSFSVSDQSAPTITIAQADPVNPLAANGTCQAGTPDFGATATDNCTSSLTVTQSPAAGEMKNLGSYQVSFTVTDAAGNTATSSNARSFSVSDQSAPTISIAQADPVNPLAANGTCQAATPDFGATATDNCTSTLTVTQSPAAGELKNLGSYQVSFTVTDAAGNTATSSNARSFSVSDQSAPTISIAQADPVNPLAANGTCQAATPDFGATATDNCTSTLTVTQSPAAGEMKTLGSYLVSFIVTDTAGNTTTLASSRSFSVYDRTAPAIAIAVADPASAFAADNNCQYGTPDFGATAVDNCDPPLTVTQTPASGVLKGLGTHQVSFIATDAAGNTANLVNSRSFSVSDQSAPTISIAVASPSSPLAANATCQAATPDFGATAQDNCSPSLTVTQSPAAGEMKNLGSYQVSFTVTDAAGNTATSSNARSFSVSDQSAPTISIANANPSSPLAANATCQAATPDFGATALDNCTPSLTVTQSPAAGEMKNLGSYQVSFTVTDAAGNTATSSNARSFSVSDQSAPTITIAQADPTSAFAADNNCQYGTPDFGATATDNCTSSLTVTQNPASGVLKGLGTHQVSFTVTDAAGNTATLSNSRSFSVSDQSAPTISIAQADPVNPLAANGTCQAATPDFGATALDNCSPSLTVTQSPAAGEMKNLGSYQVSFTVTDAAGNTATSSNARSFSVSDQSAPTISIANANPSSPLAANATCQAATPDFGATALDNCTPSLTVTQSPAAGEMKNLGSYQVSFTVTDAAGNTATSSNARSFSVSDQSAPTISIAVASPSSAFAADGNCQYATPDFGATSSDNCDGALAVTQNPASGVLKGLGTHQVSFTVTDAAGNTATLSNSRSFSVSDQSAPTISIAQADPVNPLAANGTCQAATPDFGATAQDNCSPSLTVTQSPAAGEMKNLGSYQVSFTVTDAAGNTATLSNSRSFSVSDQSAPTISIAQADPVNPLAANGTCQAATPDFGATALDNCTPSLTVTQDPAAGSLKNLGSYQVSFTVTDVAGNTATSSNARSFSVTDQTAPTITIANANPASPLSANATCQAATPDFGATASDNCTSLLTVTQSPAANVSQTVGTFQVSFTVTDAAGNTTTLANSRAFSVADTTDPTVTAPADVTANTGAGICTVALASIGTPVTADNCAVSTTVNNAPASFPMGVTTVVWTVTDVNGRSAVANQTVSIIDRQAPSITAPAAVVLSSDAGSCAKANPAIGTATASDNCGVSTVISNVAASYPVGGPYTITWTATDTSGLTATASQSLTINDTELPSITAPAAVTTPADAGSCAKALPILGTPTTSDNCAIALALSNFNPPYAVGVHTITWFAQDIYGNQKTATQSLTVTDTQDPTISAPATVNVNADAGICTASGVALGTPVTADNCAISGTVNNGTATYALGSNTVTWTTTDVNGRTASASQLVIVADNQNPTITAPAGVSVSTGAGICTAAPALGTPVTADNCSVSSTVNNAPAAFPVGATTVIWTVTDGSGRSATANQSVTVTDNEAPVISAPADVNANADQGACSAASVALGTATATDNCGISTNLASRSGPYAVGTTSVTWTATDLYGRTASATQLVIIADNQNPTISAPATVNADTDAGLCTASNVTLGSPITADNCGVSGTVNNGTATYALGSNTVTWTTTDVNGRTASAAQLVIVADNQNPTISAPANLNVSTGAGICTASPALGAPVTADNCSISSTVNNAPAAFPVGATTVVWTVTDGSGRSATASQSVTVSDNQNPTLTAPATVNVNANAGVCVATGVSLGSPTSSDNCGISGAASNNAPASFPVGSTTVVWTVLDIHGNSSTANQSVVVADNQDPTITAPAAVTSDTNIGACVATGLALGTPVTADNCGVSSVSNNAPASFTIGTVSVLWTVTDVNGRTATASQSVTVSDNQNPAVTAPANVNTVTGRGICTASPAIGSAIATDNCAVSTTVNNAPATFPLGTTTVVWTATDSSGRTASANQLVVVVDNQDPTISAPAAITTVTASGLCTASPALGTPVTADNCSVSSTVNNAPAAFPVGSTTVVWTVTDGSGRTATASQSVSVSDNQDPTISAPAAVTRSTDAGICTASNVILGSPIVADNCAINATSNNAPRIFPRGVSTVTWTTTDVNGRSATAAQSVTINDTELPTLTSPAGFLTNTDVGVCYSTRALGNATFADNCGVSSTSNNAPAQLPIGATTVTWTVTDVNGNSASALQFIMVADQRAPQFTAAPSPVSVNTDAGLCTANVALSAPAATDNCTIGTVLPNPSSSIFALGSTTVTWTATDIYGNSATATQSVTVSDAQLPTINCPANVSQSCELSTAPATTGTATGADNCSVASVNYVDGALSGGTCANTGSFNRVWTVTDGSGNSASCTQVITRVDATAPVLSMPSNATVQCNSSYLPAVTGSATATDNCDAAPSVTYSDAAPVAGSCANSSSVVRTWVATDACGNSSSNTQTISIVDSIAPVITAPSNIVVQCGTSTAPATTGTATAIDNCDAAPSVTYSDTSVTTCGSANVLTRTWLATDACGNSSTAVQTISVVDTTPPVVVGPTLLTLGLQNGGMPNIVPLVTVNDACGTVTSTQSPAAGTAAALGATTVNLTSTDSCGNSVVTPITVVISGLGANAIDLGYGCGSGVNVMGATFPVIGGDLSIAVDTDSPFAFLGLFYDSSNFAGPVFIAPGCGVHIDISVAQPFGIVSTNANGDFSATLPLPSIPQLLGFNPRMQGIVFAGSSPLGSFQLLNGIQLISGVYAPYVTARAPQLALPTGAGAVLDANYATSFPTGLVVGAQNFPGNSIGLVALKAFLANPNTQPAQFGGVLGQELAALKVNIALNAAGHLASTNNNLGSVRYRNVQVADAYNGMTLNQIAAAADAAIVAGNAATSSALALVIHQINDAFAGSAPSTFATSFLYNATF